MEFEKAKSQIMRLGYTNTKLESIFNTYDEDKKLIIGALDYVKNSDEIIYIHTNLYSVLVLTEDQLIYGRIIKPTKGFISGLFMPNCLNSYDYKNVSYSNIVTVKCKKSPDILYGQSYNFELPLKNGNLISFNASINISGKEEYLNQAQNLLSILNNKIM